MKKYILKFLLLICITEINTLPSKEANIDSLLNQIEASKEDTLKVQLLLKAALYYVDSDIDSSRYFIRKTLELSAKIGYDLYFAHANKVLSNIYYNQFITDSSIFYVNKALKYYIHLKSAKDIAICYNLLGVNYMDLADYIQASKYFIEADSTFRNIGNVAGQIVVTQNLGAIFLKIKDYNKSRQYLFKSINLNKEVNNFKNLAIGYNSLGDVYSGLNMSDSSIYFYNQSIISNQKVNDKFLLAMTLHNIGDEYKKIKKYNKAYDYFLKALKIKEGLNNLKSYATTLVCLSDVTLNLNDYTEAMKYAQKAYKISKKDTIKEVLAQASLCLANINAQYNRFKPAYQYAIEYAAWNDTLYNNTIQKTVLELNTKYETLKKDKENQLLQKENIIQKSRIKQEQLLIYAAISFLVLLSGFFIFIYRNKQQKLKAAQLIAEQNEKIAKQEYSELLNKSQINSVKAQLSGIETERERIAKELHDSVGGNLAAIKMNLGNWHNNSKPQVEQLIVRPSRARW